VPLFVLHNNESQSLGIRETYADIAASIAEYFALPNRWPVGESFLRPYASTAAGTAELKASN
jgi:phosphopentomutase